MKFTLKITRFPCTDIELAWMLVVLKAKSIRVTLLGLTILRKHRSILVSPMTKEVLARSTKSVMMSI